MKIERLEKGTKGMFYAGDAAAPLAEMNYTMPSPDKMIIEHTEVSDELKGQHVGYDLVSAGVEYARAHQIKIVPLCPFASAVFKKKKDYEDVLFQN